MTAHIEILQSGRLEQTLRLADGVYSIGRDPSADIVLESKTVSKNHATLVIDEGSFRITDNGSSNGVYCRGKKISEQTFSGAFQIEMEPFTIRTAPREESVSAGKPSFLPASAGLFIGRNIKAAFFAGMALVMLLTLMIVYASLKSSVQSIYQQERMKNGMLLSRYLAEMNRPFLETTDHALVRTGPVRREDGVRYAIVVDERGRIIAPHARQGDFFNWQGLPGALRDARERVEKTEGGESLIFTPIVFQGKTVGGAIIGFAADSAGEGSGAGIGGKAVFLLVLLFGLAMAISYFLARLFLAPLRQLSEEIEVSVKEGWDHVSFRAPYEELDNIRRIVNRLLLRKTLDTAPSDPARTAPARDGGRISEIRPAPAENGPGREHSTKPAGGALPADLPGPWCVVNEESYTLVQCSETFARELGQGECREGMHIIEALGGDVILAVNQVLEGESDVAPEVDAAGKTFRAARMNPGTDSSNILIVFEETAK